MSGPNVNTPGWLGVDGAAARRRRADAQLLGVQAARRRHAGSAARSSGSTTRRARWPRRAPSRSASWASRRSTSSTASKPRTPAAQPGMALERDRAAGALPREAPDRRVRCRSRRCGCSTPARPISRPARSRCSTCSSRRATIRRLLQVARGRRSGGPESARAHRRKARSTSPISKRGSCAPRTR